MSDLFPFPQSVYIYIQYTTYFQHNQRKSKKHVLFGRFTNYLDRMFYKLYDTNTIFVHASYNKF